MSDNYQKTYIPTDWISDQVISEELMDHIEGGISNAYLWLTDLDSKTESVVTEQDVEDIIDARGYITKNVNDLTYYTLSANLPTNISAFTNDVGYVTAAQLPVVPTNVSAFTNDAGYVTIAQVPVVPTNISAFTNDAGYITAAQVPNGVFVAEYGTTTYADVLAAYQNGKAIICKKDDTITYLTVYDSYFSYFYFDHFREGRSIHRTLSSSNGWSLNTTNYVGTGRTINNKALSSNITLTAADVGATTQAQVQTMIDTAIAAIPVADQTVYAQSNS